jgi:hypothetical protein
MNITSVNVAQPGALRNFSRKSERGGREMERHIGAEPVHDPFRVRGDLQRAVVVPGIKSVVNAAARLGRTGGKILARRPLADQRAQPFEMALG